MALTESRLRQIIREEAKRVMAEGPYSDRRDWGTMYDRGPGADARARAWDDEDMRQRGGRGYDEYDPDEEDFPEDEEDDY